MGMYEVHDTSACRDLLHYREAEWTWLLRQLRAARYLQGHCTSEFPALLPTIHCLHYPGRRNLDLWAPLTDFQSAQSQYNDVVRRHFISRRASFFWFRNSSALVV